LDKRLNHLNALRTFESAARHQSYSKAAEELFVSQAAVSQQMRQLEQGLQAKLFLRVGRTMQLTQSGEKLFHSTSQAFITLIQGLNSIQCEEIAGDLTLTSTQAFCSLWLMPRLFRFAQIHPDVNIKIQASNQIVDLAKNHIDLAIRFGLKEKQVNYGNLTQIDFGEDQAYPVCSPKLLSDMKIDKPEDLLKCNLVSLSNEKVITWQAWFEHAGVSGFEKHNQKTEVTSSDMGLSAVLSGHGVTLAAMAMSAQYLENKQLVIPFQLKHPCEWRRYLVYDPNSAKLKRIKAFTDWLQHEMSLSKKNADAMHNMSPDLS